MSRLLLLTGNRVWPSRSRIAAELAAYSPATHDLMHGACPTGADDIADQIAVERGWVPGMSLHRRPAQWLVNGRMDPSAGPRRNEAMAVEATSGRWSSVEGLAFGERGGIDSDRELTGTGHMVALLRVRGLPVRWIPAPDQEAHTLALRVYTARCNVGRDPDDLDITRAHGGDKGAPWAPSWGILKPALEARSRAAALRAEGRLEEADAIEEAAWAVYEPAFVEEMRRSWKANPQAWRALLARDRVVLRCRCADPARCHRAILRERILPALGAVDCGELQPEPSRQLSLLEPPT